MAVATQNAPPSHGRGTAAEQGARIRAQMQQKTSTRNSPSSSHQASRRSSAHVDADEEKQRKARKEEERRRSEQKQRQQQRDEEKRREKEAKAAEKERKVETEAKPAKEPASKVTNEKQHAKEPASEVTNEKQHHSNGHAAVAPPSTSTKKANLEPKGYCYPVSGVDNIALLMEGDHYQTTCFSVYEFKTELDSDTLLRFFNKLVASYPKYGYVAELSAQEAAKKEKARKAGKTAAAHEPTDEERRGRRTKYSKTLKAGGWFRPARWRYDETFDVRDNIVELDGCPGGGKDDAALFKLAGDFLSEHFDYTKPLWKALCVRGLQTEKGATSALMIKVHHALSDGQGMIMSYHTALAALENDAPIKDIQAHVDTRAKKGTDKQPGQRNIHPTLWGTTKHGWHTVRGLYFRSRKAFDYSDAKRVAGRFYCHSDGIPMADIKLVRDAFSDAGLDLTLNDVACAVLSRALRVAAERTEPHAVKDKRVAIFVPISIRPHGNWELANYTTGAIAWFAFNDPAKVPFKQQLAQVHREMNRIKRSYWPRIWISTFASVSKRRAWFVPNYPIGKQFFERTYREYHVATNLPGPSKPVKFGEHEAFSYHVLPPSSPGKSSMAIGMISYANDFSLAVSCDAAQEIKQRRLAEEICTAFQDAAKELVQAAKAERAQHPKNE